MDHTYWLADYSTALSKLIYLGNIEKFPGFIFWDVASQKMIWQAVDPKALIKIPRWSPSGNAVAVISGGVLEIIDQNGMVTVSRNLLDNFEVMNIA